MFLVVRGGFDNRRIERLSPSFGGEGLSVAEMARRNAHAWRVSPMREATGAAGVGGYRAAYGRAPLSRVRGVELLAFGECFGGSASLEAEAQLRGGESGMDVDLIEALQRDDPSALWDSRRWSVPAPEMDYRGSAAAASRGICTMAAVSGAKSIGGTSSRKRR